MVLNLGTGLAINGLSRQGGGAPAPFAIADQALAFGALTLEGAGGIKPVTSGTPAGAYQISGGQSANYSVDASGFITPASDGAATDGDSFVYGDGTTSATITIAVAAKTYSVRPDNAEIEAAWEAISTDGDATILVRNGSNATDAGPVSLAAKAATAEIVIQPENYAAAASNVTGTGVADARLSTRPVTLRGFVAEGVIDYLTIKGFRCIRDQFSETNTNGIINLQKGSAHVQILDNEIAMVTSFTSRDFVSDGAVPLLKGVAAASGTGPSNAWIVNNNWFHDLWVGPFLDSLTNSEISKNLIFDVYGSFTRLGGGSDTVKVNDNLGLGVWAHGIPGGDFGGTHASIGGSFDPDIANIDFIGNVFAVGNARFLYDGNYPGATGAKFNDPTSETSYQNLRIAENLLIISSSLGLELSGVAGADVWNNTIVGTPDDQGSTGSGPDISADYTSSDIRYWNNIHQTFYHGDHWAGTEVSEYGNFPVLAPGVSGVTSHENVFAGSSFAALTIEQIIAAYKPKSGTYPQVNVIGYGTSGYTVGDDGLATPTFTLPSPTGGTAVDYGLTAWGGNAYATISSGTLGDGAGDAGVFAIELANLNLTASNQFFSTASNYINIATLATSGTLRISVKNSSGTIVMTADVIDLFPASPTDDRIRLAISYDLSAGRLVLAKDGVPITVSPATTLLSDAVHDNADTWRIGATSSATGKLNADFGMAYYDNRFVDLNTTSGLNELFDATGGFRTFANAGLLWYYGDRAALEAGAVNHGSGNGFTLTGSVEDVGSSYNQTRVTFDGSNDYITYTPDTSFANAAGLTLSVWIDVSGADSDNLTIINHAARIVISRNTSGKLSWIVVNTSATALWTGTTDATHAEAEGLIHFALAFDGSAGTGQVYVNGVSVAHTDTVAPAAGTVHWNRAVASGLFGSSTGSAKFNGEVGDLWLDNSYLDLSANIGKFISSGVPVDLGANGETPTGLSPLIFMGGTMAAADWNDGTNLGSVQSVTFTMTGAVV
jgi:hypothetical protein